MGFLYCGRSSDAFWIKTGLSSSLGTSQTFEGLTSTSELFDYLRDDFLPAMFPQTDQGTGKELTCNQKQFLVDGTNVRVGNLRLRQIRVGLNEPTRERWTSANLDKYASCEVPEMFQDAMGGRCFRDWGYKTSGLGAPQQFHKNYRLASWQVRTTGIKGEPVPGVVAGFG